MAEAILGTPKACAVCGITKPRSDFGAKKSGRDGLRTACKECRRAECSVWRARNPGYRMEYYEANKVVELERGRATKQAYYLANRERMNQQSLGWAKANPALLAARAMHRLNLKRMATPSWADDNEILSFYEEAERRRLETGSPWHVDHIVPLKSRHVCGLHVQGNLAVIPAAENLAKSNRRWPDMP